MSLTINPDFSLPFNVTSLPQVNSPLHPAIFSTLFKELRKDPTEREQLKQNLHELGKHNEVIDLRPLTGDTEPFNLQTIRSLEQLARGYAYHAVHEDQISIPIDGKMILYTVEEIPLLFGMTAYGLKPKNLDEPPILLFRGTSFYPSGRGAFATLIADIDPLSPGTLLHKIFCKKINRWLTFANQTYSKKPYVTGHSLAGGLASLTSIKFPHLVQKYCFTHGSVGLSFLAKRKFNRLEKEGNAPKIFNFFHEKDPFTKWGHHHVGTDIQIQLDLEKSAPVQEKIKWRFKTLSHRLSLLDKRCTLTVKKSSRLLPTWIYIPLFIIPFIGGTAALLSKRLIIGTYNSKPYTSLLGPLRWVWHKTFYFLKI